MRSVPPTHTRPVWAEISASRLRANFAALQHTAGPQIDMLAVIKADAYGHGAVECAPLLQDAGAHWLGVTSAEEGVAVRQALRPGPGASPRVLVMCGVWPGEAASIMERDLTPVVWEPYHLDLLEAEALRRKLPPQSLPVHLEIDTGMARQGVTAGPALEHLLPRFARNSPLHLEGVMTHLASTECVGDPQNATQFQAFRCALQQIYAAGLSPAFVHAGNTSSTDSGDMREHLPGIVRQCNSKAKAMTRAGLALYGYALPLSVPASPLPADLTLRPRLQPALQPAMTWKTRIVGLRNIQPGDTVGYNATFVAPSQMHLALLPVGYADGLRRALSASNQQPGGAVLIRGRRAPIVGRVSMDLTVVDVSTIPEAALADEAVLLGTQGDQHIGADEHARLAETSVYEILCGISDRVPRMVVP